MSFTSPPQQGQQGGGNVVLGGPPGGSTGTTTGGGSTSGGGTGGGTGGDPGDNSVGGAIGTLKLLRVEEIKSANSAYAVGSTITTSSTRHVTRLKLRMPNSTTYGATDPDGTQHRSRLWVPAIGVEPSAEIGADGTLPTVGWWNSGTPSILYITGSGEWIGYVQIGSSGALSSGQIKLWACVYTSSEKLPPGETQWQTVTENQTWGLATLNVNKVLLNSVSLDSRRTYGQPNLDGEIPGDANADLRNPSFNGWNFKGGHFVGNMPAGATSDQSGLARTQLSTDSAGGSTGYIAGCCTLFATGRRGSTSGGVVGMFNPSSSDTNINQGLNAIWSNRWDINPRSNPGTPPDYTQDPFWWITSTTDNQNQYWNWQLPYQTENNPTGPWSRICLAQTVESGQTWQYFSSVWNQALTGQTFPITDSQPRLWVVRTN